MQIILGAALVAGIVASLGYLGWVHNCGLNLQSVKLSSVMPNDDRTAKTHFIKLLGEAKSSMIVYDDGNVMSGSVYESQEVIEAVRCKIESDHEFQLLCLFNCYEPKLMFRRELADLPSVQIRTRAEGDGGGTHYKIIDDGLKGYLSKHEFGKDSRLYKTVDCSDVPERYRKYASNAVLGGFIDDFKSAFANAKPAA